MNSLGISQWPIEILAKLTSLLTDADIVLKLFGCGNLLLKRRLIEGGVTHLTLTLPKLTPRNISIIQSLRLRSFEHQRSSCSDREIVALARGLHPTLRSLTLNHVEDVLVTSVLNPNSAVTVTCSAHRVWRIRESFPDLHTLNLDHDMRFEHPDLAIQFLLGLPQSLTHLSLPIPLAPIDVWRILPPNLTSLSGLIGAFPTLETVARFDSLTSLELSASQETIGMRSEDDEGEFASAPEGNQHATVLHPWMPISDPSLLCLPPHLTSLDANLVFSSKHVLPATLTSLSWRNTGDELDLCELFGVIPTSVTHLTAQSRALVVGSEVSSTSLSLPSLLRLELKGSVLELSSTSELNVHAFLLGSAPNIERLVLKYRTSVSPLDGGLGPDSLGLMNSSRLRYLRADLAASCFEPDGGADTVTYPLHVFTKLETLVLRRRKLANFTFASLPSSLTSFQSSTGFSSKTLHLAPSSLTDLACGLSLDANVELLPNGLLASSPTTSASSPSPSPSSSLTNTESTVLASSEIEPVAVDFRLGGARTRLGGGDRVLLELGRYNTMSHPTTLNFVAYPPLPSTLTSLTLGLNGIDIPCNAIAPTALPHLSYLSFGYDNIPHEVDVGAFTSLQTLKFRCFPEDSIATCPPNLTSLIGRKLELPSSFLPLPSSLTKIKTNVFSPHDALLPLMSLKTLQIYAKTSDILKLHTANVTSLYLCEWTREEVKILSTRLPSLQTLYCSDFGCEYADFDLLYQSLPHVTFHQIHIEFNEGNFVELLMKRSGINHGELVLEPSKGVYRSFEEMLRRAYPRVANHATVWRIRFNAGSWASYSKLLRSDTTIIDISGDRVTMSTDFAVHLPRTLTTLVLSEENDGDVDNPQELINTSSLPRTLTSLEHPIASITVENINDLPHTLTRLSIKQVSNLTSHASTLSWPTNLFDLEIYSFEVEPSVLIMTLPPTLVTLRLNEWVHAVSESDFALLPPSLKYFAGNFESSTNITSLCQSRGLTRLIQTWEWKEYSYDCGYPMMLDTLVSKYALEHKK